MEDSLLKSLSLIYRSKLVYWGIMDQYPLWPSFLTSIHLFLDYLLYVRLCDYLRFNS